MAYPSTYGNVRTAVINKLRMDATNDLAQVGDWVNRVYAHTCIDTETTQTFATLTMTAGSSSYTLPSAIVRIKQLLIQPVGQSAYGPPLDQVPLEEILELRQSASGVSATGSYASRYAVVGYNQLEFYPTPASADTLLVYYVYAPTALSSSSDTPVIPEPWATAILEYGALAEGADFMRDPQESGYRQLYEMWLQRYRVHLDRRKGGHTLQMRIAGQIPWSPHDRSTDLRWA